MLKLQNKTNKIYDLINTLLDIFSDNFFFEIQRINDSQLDEYENNFIALSTKYKIPLISSNNVKFEKASDHNAHDALLCISKKTTINQDNRIFSNPETYFKSSDQMYELFHDIPEVIENNFNLALKCQFFLKEILPKLPKFSNVKGLSENELLIKNAKIGLVERVKSYDLSDESYKKRLIYELKIINKMGFAGYFLIVADFVNWAKKHEIAVGPGRGSGAGSVVAWALRITDLDPIKYGLLFERFLNPERVSMPDFDIDFCQNRRDEVIEYVSNKYGRDCVAHIITFGTLASRAAVRDVGRVLEIPYSEVDQFAKLIPYNPANPLTLEESINSDKNLKEYVNKDDRISNIVDISLKLEGLHRHASTHAAGVVIGDSNLMNRVPLYKDPNTSVNATQFSMKYVEKAGLIKFDFLGLTTLSIIQDTTKLIHKTNKEFNLSKIPMDDKQTYNRLSKGDAVGVFQLESSGMSSVLKQLQPDRFEEIIAVVALFRPGPMENIPSFCNRKHGREKIEYLHPLLEKILKETYGIIVYQEQVMQIAQILSNYTLGEADLLRRAMGKKIQKEMDDQKNRFVEGAKNNGINVGEALTIFDLVDKFAGYGFNKSHAAGYALLAYQTAYLKTNFPYEFMTASLNYSIDRTDRIILLKKELNKLNIILKKPDINYSNSKFSIEKSKATRSIRFALSAVKGVGVGSMNNLVSERESNGKYSDIIDFMNRLKGDVINKRQLEKLIQSGSFESVYKNRSKLFINVPNFVEIYGGIHNTNDNQKSLFEVEKLSFEDKNIFNQDIIEWSSSDLLKNELEVLGFYFSNHPLSLYPKNYFVKNNIVDFEDVIADTDIEHSKIAGAILDIKERSNKDGRKYAFLTISNPKAQFELSIFNDKLREFRHLIKEGNVLIFHIDISRDNENIRMIIRKIEDLDRVFSNQRQKYNVFLSNISDLKLIDSLLKNSDNNLNELFIFYNKNNKLVSLDFSKNYEISNYSYLDQLNNAKKIDYSIDFI